MIMISLCVFHFYYLDGLIGWFCSVIFVEDTHYSSRYSDNGFRLVRVGMRAGNIIHILGEPLQKMQFKDPYEEYWYYSESPNGKHYRVRILVLDKYNCIKKKISEYYVD